VSDDAPHELVIIKRRSGGQHDEHHGGAWKIAFADFMTAMMALFLVLWLISAASPKIKGDVARYFNPVKLAEMSTVKRGLSDPKEGPPSSETDQKGQKSSHSAKTVGDEKTETEAKNDKSLPPPGANPEGGAGKQPGYSENALFRDPYAVLAEIAAAGAASEASRVSEGNARAGSKGAELDGRDSFQDPFATVPREFGPQAAFEPRDQGKSIKPSEPAAKLEARPQLSANQVTVNTAAERNQREQQANTAEAEKLQNEIVDALKKTSGLQMASNAAPNVEVRSTDEGVLISLTDEYDYSMFAIGSAEPQPKTVQVMERIAQILKMRPGTIIIRGHTDGRAYKSLTYDNWRLSSARAHMAHYMLVRGGLDEKRFERIEGFADRRLKSPNDSLAAENRRIEILLRKDKP
jgi:chemotaxis protein MotB